jgi:virulence-associated protein VagC
MGVTAKLFMNGRSQAVRLPAEFRFEGTEVDIRRDPETGDVILSQKPQRTDTGRSGLLHLLCGNLVRPAAKTR